MKLPTPFQGMNAIKTLVTGAEAHAEALGDASTGAEHLVLSALDLPDGSARRVFARVGADPDAFAGAIAESHDSALRQLGIEPVCAESLGAGSRRTPSLNESAARVMRSAASRSRTNRPELLGAQVVAAAAELEHGTAARALRQLGIDRDELGVAAEWEIRKSA